MESIIKAIKEQKQFYKNKDGSFKEDTEGNKISKPPLKDSTLKTYSANFKKIAGDNSLTDLSWLKDIDNIKEKLKDLSVRNDSHGNDCRDHDQDAWNYEIDESSCWK